MIYGIGIDIVKVERLEKWLSGKNAQGLINRFFHKLELEAALADRKTAALRLAARFAAKEAFGKALGTGLKGIRLKDICVKSSHNGKPELLLYDTAQIAMKNAGAKKAFVSLSHEKEIAVGIVVLET
ncbi:MAG: holo-ACP synthase [Treponemataceae bacterium]